MTVVETVGAKRRARHGSLAHHELDVAAVAPRGVRMAVAAHKRRQRDCVRDLALAFDDERNQLVSGGGTGSDEAQVVELLGERVRLPRRRCARPRRRASGSRRCARACAGGRSSL
jgi:hypothetical protein